MTDAIFALATAPGRAAVAVVRVSGPGAGAALAALTRRQVRPRRASLRELHDTAGEVLDQAMVIWFPGPASYTGEDVVELHLHGGVGVVDAVTGALLALGLRLAAPGEFTRRAFENGKLNLDQAEAVADLVDAQTTAQARQALGQLEGRLGRRYESWREGLLGALARLEAAVDFPDEEVPSDVADQARDALATLAADLDAALADQARGCTVREGYRVAVIGAPNAGKSTLVNALAAREAAIVTPIPGTTRDVIEIPLIVCGYLVLLADTAGVRDTVEPIEVEGVRRAKAWALAADLRICVVDASASDGSWSNAAPLVRPGDLCVLSKADLPAGSDAREAVAAAGAIGIDVVRLSLLKGGGAAVEPYLARRVREQLAGAEFPAATRARHAALLRDARDHLGRALADLREPELAAEDVRLTARVLARITGRIDAEDVLGRVFSTFCIGK